MGDSTYPPLSVAFSNTGTNLGTLTTKKFWPPTQSTFGWVPRTNGFPNQLFEALDLPKSSKYGPQGAPWFATK